MYAISFSVSSIFIRNFYKISTLTSYKKHKTSSGIAKAIHFYGTLTGAIGEVPLSLT